MIQNDVFIRMTETTKDAETEKLNSYSKKRSFKKIIFAFRPNLIL